MAGTATFTWVGAARPSYGELKLNPLEKAWMKASNEVLKDTVTKADAANENFLNHAIWYSATNWKRPYPGETKVLKPASFVKAALQGLKRPATATTINRDYR